MEVDYVLGLLEDIAKSGLPFTGVRRESRIEGHHGYSGFLLTFNNDEEEIKIPPLIDLVREKRLEQEGRQK
jgi:hypothetical protein